MWFLSGGRGFLCFAEAAVLPQGEELLDVGVGAFVLGLVGDLGDGLAANEGLRAELLALPELLVEDVFDGYPQLRGGRQLGGGNKRDPKVFMVAADNFRADPVVRPKLAVTLVYFLNPDAVLSGTRHLVIGGGQHFFSHCAFAL